MQFMLQGGPQPMLGAIFLFFKEKYTVGKYKTSFRPVLVSTV